MTGIHFTADLHLGHRLVSELRGFDSPDDHDQALCDHWSDAVASGDQVWVLGDVTLGNPGRPFELLRALPGVKHLIAGNHDRVHPRHRDAHKFHRAYMEAFDSVATMATRRVLGEKVLLSHFPYHGDSDIGERFAEYRLRDEGMILLHGHTHSAERITGAREIHVGLDAWNLTPVPLSKIDDAVADMQHARQDRTPTQYGSQ